MREIKRLGIISVAAFVALGLSGCSAEESTPEPTVASSPEPEAEPEVDLALAFGDVARLDYAGSIWEIRIDEPRDVTEEVAKEYENTGLEIPLEEGMTYIGVPGSLTRIGDGPADPFSEVTVEAVIDNRSISADSQSLTDPPAIMDVGELFPDGQAEFVEIFMVPGGTTIPTVSVTAGMGEAGQRVFFGETVDLGTSESESSTPDVESMKYVWSQATADEKAISYSTWGLDNGAVTSEGVAQLIQETGEAGIILDEAEATEFLEWVLAQ